MPFKKKKDSYPLEIWKGQSVVTIYCVPIAGKERFQLRWQESGKMERKTYTSPDKAKAEASIVVTRLQAGEVGSITLNSDESAVYRRAVAACGGTPLDVVCKEWATARKKIGEATLAQVSDDYAKRHSGTPIKVSALITLFEGDKAGRDLSETYLNRISNRLAKVEKQFGERFVSEVTEIDIRHFVDAQGGGPRNRKHMRDAVTSVWKFGQQEGYLPKNVKTEAEMVTAPKIKRATKIEIFTPGEMQKLLEAAPAHILPALAICAFTGIRSQGEIARLKWENFKWDQNVIEVTESKTGARRLPPILPCLAAWLADYKEAKGPVIELVPDKAFLRTAKSAKVSWRHNALRHSFGSYRVAQTKSIDQVALEMGNSPGMVKRHYLEAVHEAEATAFFCIMPPAK